MSARADMPQPLSDAQLGELAKERRRRESALGKGGKGGEGGGKGGGKGGKGGGGGIAAFLADGNIQCARWVGHTLWVYTVPGRMAGGREGTSMPCTHACLPLHCRAPRERTGTPDVYPRPPPAARRPPLPRRRAMRAWPCACACTVRGLWTCA